MKKAHIELARRSQRICAHILGEENTVRGRMIAGFVVMLCGVCIAKSAGYFHNFAAHIGLDLLGYGVHGLGAVPYIEWLLGHLAAEEVAATEAAALAAFALPEVRIVEPFRDSELIDSID